MVICFKEIPTAYSGGGASLIFVALMISGLNKILEERRKKLNEIENNWLLLMAKQKLIYFVWLSHYYHKYYKLCRKIFCCFYHKCWKVPYSCCCCLVKSRFDDIHLDFKMGHFDVNVKSIIINWAMIYSIKNYHPII